MPTFSFIRRARTGLLAVTALLLPTPSAAAQQTSTTALDNHRTARELLDRAVTAVGGTAAVRDFVNLEAAYTAHGTARGQSRRPGPPWDSTHAAGRFQYDTDGRVYHEERFVNTGGTDRSFRRALLDEGSWNLWVARDLLQPIEPSDVAFLRGQAALNPTKALPHSLLRAALSNLTSLHFLGETEQDGVRYGWIAFVEPDGDVATLGIDLTTGRPGTVERLGSDRLAGDATFAVHFEDYRQIGGLAVPHRLTFSINGSAVRTSVLSQVTVNQPADSSRFAPPPELTAVEHPPRFTPIPIAPGVHMVRLYSGPANSYNTVLVEFDDHVVVLEAPLVGAFFPVIRRIAAALAPGKPIRSVVTTHHHHDHAGGAARFLAAGIDVIAPPHAVAVIRAMAEARHTLASTHVAGSPPGDLVPVADSLVLSDGMRTLRLLQVGPTPHVDQILVAHLPQDRVLFVADLFAVPETRVFPPVSETFAHFARLVDRFDLDFDHLVPTHGLVGTPADLEAATRKSSETNGARGGVGLKRV